MKKKHIVLFNPDQWRGDVMGHMGDASALTPHLDAMVSRDAVSFRSAFCQNPVCTPSRCSLMSGWYPHVRGHRTMFHMMAKDEPVLLKILKDSGWHVWWGGKNDLIPGENGVADYCTEKFVPSPHAHPITNLHGNATGWRGAPDADNFYSFMAGRCEMPNGAPYLDDDWLNVLGAAERIRTYEGEEPLCIYLPLLYPHPPYGVEEPFFSAIDRSKLPPRAPAAARGKPSLEQGIRSMQGLEGWTEERWNELRATYRGMCARVDAQFALLMDALREKGIYDDTLVVFYSDHGDFTGDYGLVEKTQNTFEDCLTRVPLLIKPPKDEGCVPGVRDALAELIDIPATLYDYCGIDPQYTLFGKSLRGIIAGEEAAVRDAVFCEGGRLHGEAHCMERESLRGKDDELGLYYPRLHWQLGEGPEHTKATMCRTKTHKYVQRLYESDELYDLEKDPQELCNRIDDPDYAPVLMALKDRLLRFYLETGDVVPWQPNRR